MEKRQYKVLAVDDNPKNIQVIGSILREANYQVGFAFNGQQALELLDESKDYDLILLDINMPVMNGYEICIKIRKDPSLTDIPIIFLTALNEVENIVRGFESGGQDYIAKPFNARELLARVHTHVELKASREKLKRTNEWLEEKVNERTLELQQSNRELEMTNQKLEKAYHELELLDEAKADFLGIISHEINTPLNGIIGFTNILKEELKNAEFYDMINFLDISARRLENFASTSLLITELRTKRKYVFWNDVNLEQLWEEISGSFMNRITKKEINLEIKKGLETIWADRRLLKRSLENVMDNAIKYSPQKGVITVSVLKQENFVVCSIEDEGPGFLPKIMEDPFQLFTYGKEHMDEDKGLNLALVKLIMDAHHGEIEIANKKTGGAIVSLKFKDKPSYAV